MATNLNISKSFRPDESIRHPSNRFIQSKIGTRASRSRRGCGNRSSGCYTNLAIHRHREEEMNRERMRHNQTVQEAASQRAREANKGKAREVVPDSEEEESEEMY
ncbi:hypothetical protein PIB30_040877 [Stylosanthes scabra]|uniref:Uncharacterized protein n=1 Tax=Stylosanthes scabra TaxID=79078 RepID=A0ABU6SFG1_9FABA|nr:hypothetical protein [Stylosanthes scabra]